MSPEPDGAAGSARCPEGSDSSAGKRRSRALRESPVRKRASGPTSGDLCSVVGGRRHIGPMTGQHPGLAHRASRIEPGQNEACSGMPSPIEPGRRIPGMMFSGVAGRSPAGILPVPRLRLVAGPLDRVALQRHVRIPPSYLKPSSPPAGRRPSSLMVSPGCRESTFRSTVANPTPVCDFRRAGR